MIPHHVGSARLDGRSGQDAKVPVVGEKKEDALGNGQLWMGLYVTPYSRFNMHRDVVLQRTCIGREFDGDVDFESQDIQKVEDEGIGLVCASGEGNGGTMDIQGVDRFNATITGDRCAIDEQTG